jgi:hypothetical protein
MQPYSVALAWDCLLYSPLSTFYFFSSGLGIHFGPNEPSPAVTSLQEPGHRLSERPISSESPSEEGTVPLQPTTLERPQNGPPRHVHPKVCPWSVVITKVVSIAGRACPISNERWPDLRLIRNQSVFRSLNSPWAFPLAAKVL